MSTKEDLKLIQKVLETYLESIADDLESVSEEKPIVHLGNGVFQLSDGTKVKISAKKVN